MGISRVDTVSIPVSDQSLALLFFIVMHWGLS